MKELKKNELTTGKLAAGRKNRKALYSKKLSKQLISLSILNKDRLHIIPSEGKWVVKQSRIDLPIKIYKEYTEALDYVKKQLESGNISSYVVHNEKGVITYKEGITKKSN